MTARSTRRPSPWRYAGLDDRHSYAASGRALETRRQRSRSTGYRLAGPRVTFYERMFPSSRMTDLHESAALVALLRRGDRPWHHYAALVELTGSALAVLRGDFEEPGDPQHRLFDNTDFAEPDLDAVASEIRAWLRDGIHLITILDQDYPTNLRSIHNRPPLLFVRGELTSGDDQAVAVVGTRKATPDGLDAARDMAVGIARSGFTVVSGLAEGVDTAAHEATLDVGNRTIAVIGTGLRRSYPPQNTELQRRLGDESAVLSQFWPDAPPTRTSFPMRNVVMSGLSLATVVIEASGASGARMQARFALEHGRPVFLLRTLLSHDWAREYAKRPGTYVVVSAAEVVERVAQLTAVDALSA